MSEQILVVEDFAPVRELLQECLSYAGYDVVEAENGREALSRLNGRTPDLLLLDVRLPDISGWDLLWLIRVSPKWTDIPVVLLTGLSDDASKAYGWSLGCSYYLTKPVALSDLLLVVRKLLAGTQMEVDTPMEVDVQMEAV